MKLLAVLLLSLLLCGCDPQDTEEVTSIIEPAEELEEVQPDAALPEELILPYLQQQTLDPLVCPDGIQQMLGCLLYEPLFSLDEGFDPQPCLCRSYEYDPATMSYLLQLEEKVRFSDGSTLQAQDVVTALQRAKDTVRYGARFAHVASIQAVGSTQLRITLTEPNERFPALLEIPITKTNPTNKEIPLGTGPYLYLTDSSGSYLQENTDWWKGEALPLQRIALRQVRDEDTALWLFSSRELPFLTASLTQDTTVSLSGNVSLTELPTTVLHYLGCNTRSGLCADAALRAALSRGIDRSTLTGAYLAGHADAASFPLSPRSSLYPIEEEPSYSLVDYTGALASAGWNRTAALRLIVCADNSFKTAVAHSIANSLTASGLTVEVQELDFADYRTALESGAYDLYLAEVKLTADWDLKPLLASNGSLNLGGYSDPAMDSLLQQGIRTAAPAIAELLVRDTPIIPLYFLRYTVLSTEGMLENATPTASNPFYSISQWKFHFSTH